MKELKKAMGIRIRSIRNSLSLNQEDFGKKIGVSGPAMSTYELGDVQVPYEILLKISDLGKTTLDWILRGEKTDLPKDERETQLLLKFRKAKELKVAEKIESYTAFTIREVEKKPRNPSSQKSQTLRHKEG